MNFGGSHTKNEVRINNATKPFWGGGICSKLRGVYSQSCL